MPQVNFFHVVCVSIASNIAAVTTKNTKRAGTAHATQYSLKLYPRFFTAYSPREDPRSVYSPPQK